MNTQYEPIIGLEIHVELSTKSKMFCSCSADYFGKEPNTHTCPVCLGLPGALPQTNQEALNSCMKIGLALGCTVSESSRFERKNYFYPDLPKGFQISQYRWPLCKYGKCTVHSTKGETREIRINRVHQEEDTGKLFHMGGETLIDYNRSGVPLVEIVTEPDFCDTEEIRDYAKKLQQISRYLGVSNADMERGDMRLEANVSVRRQTVNGKRNEELPPYRVELKNINSFRFMVAAVEYEIKRQTEALENGERLTQETRGWNEDKKETYTQRVKEEANDYRYFPEPDIPELKTKSKLVNKLRDEMPELPEKKVKRFIEDYSLPEAWATILTDTQEFADYYEEAARLGVHCGLNAQQIANTLINKKLNRNEILPAVFIEMLLAQKEKAILPDDELEKAVVQSIEQNPQAVEDYKKGKETTVQFLLGQVMRETRGQADPNRANELIVEHLKK